MHIDTIQALLRSHRQNIGRCEYLAARIAGIKNQIITTSHDITESEAIKAQQYSGMPHGSSVGDPTANLAIRLASGLISDDVRELYADLSKLKREHTELCLSLSYVSAWLSGLTEKERWIIENQVIDGMYWREIVIQYRSKFGEMYSKDGLKRMRDKAMEKIYHIAS